VYSFFIIKSRSGLSITGSSRLFYSKQLKAVYYKQLKAVYYELIL